MKRVLFLLLTALLALSWGAASAQKTYKWVDDQGNVSYHDRPPPANSPYTVQEKRISTPRERATDANEDAALKNPVVLYTVPSCTSCESARQYLKGRNVPFTEKNVESDVKLQQELKQKVGSLTVPAILIGAKVMNGYMESLLAGELDQAGYAKPAAATEAEKGKPEDSGYKAPTQ